LRLARELGVNVTAVNSGYSEEGDTSVGGESVVSLQAQKLPWLPMKGSIKRVFGSIWWTSIAMESRSRPMTIGNIKSGRLKDFNVLILPDGSAGRYFSAWFGRYFGDQNVGSKRRDGYYVVELRFAALKRCRTDVRRNCRQRRR